MAEKRKLLISINVRSATQPNYKLLAKRLVHLLSSAQHRFIDLSIISHDNQTIDVIEIQPNDIIVPNQDLA